MQCQSYWASWIAWRPVWDSRVISSISSSAWRWLRTWLPLGLSFMNCTHPAMLFGSLKLKLAKGKCSPGRSVMSLCRLILWRVGTRLMQEIQRIPRIMLNPLDSLHSSNCKCLNLKLNWLKCLISSKRTNSSSKSPSKSKMSTSSSLQSRNSSRKGTKTHWPPARSRMWLNFSLSTDNW